MLDEERSKEIAKAYRDALFPLLVFSVEELEEYQKSVDDSISRFTAFAPLLDPADYFTKIKSGELNSFQIQAEASKHLLAARKEIQKLGADGILGLAHMVMMDDADVS